MLSFNRENIIPYGQAALAELAYRASLKRNDEDAQVEIAKAAKLFYLLKTIEDRQRLDREDIEKLYQAIIYLSDMFESLGDISPLLGLDYHNFVNGSLTTFISLSDTPTNYSGQAGKTLVVADDELGLRFGESQESFLGLNDTPNNYSGQAGKILTVSNDESELEFINSLSADLTQDLEVNGVSLGGIPNLTFYAEGTAIEDIIRQLLIVAISPTYIAPTISFTGSPAAVNNNYEAGTSLTPNFIGTFNQNDAGALSEMRLRLTTTTLNTSPTSPLNHTVTQFTLGDETRPYNIQADYAEGATKNNNLGNPDPTGKILAGTITTANRNFTGQRNAFWGVNSQPNNSAGVRSLGNSQLGAVNGSSFNISIPSGATSVCFAYRATLQGVTSVKYVELSNQEVKNTFTETTVSVEGANGFSAINYRVYTYVPAVPFGSTATYNVTI